MTATEERVGIQNLPSASFRLTDLPEEIQSKIMPILDGCWLWTGTHQHPGYGTLSKSNKWNKSRLAHRIVYELLVGPISRPVLHHLCEQPACVNPNHLEPTDQAGNMRHAWGYEGDRCPWGHLREERTGAKGCSNCRSELTKARQRALSDLQKAHLKEFQSHYKARLKEIRGEK